MIYSWSVLYSTVSERHIGLRVGFQLPYFLTFSLSPSQKCSSERRKTRQKKSTLERTEETQYEAFEELNKRE